METDTDADAMFIADADAMFILYFLQFLSISTNLKLQNINCRYKYTLKYSLTLYYKKKTHKNSYNMDLLHVPEPGEHLISGCKVSFLLRIQFKMYNYVFCKHLGAEGASGFYSMDVNKD